MKNWLQKWQTRGVAAGTIVFGTVAAKADAPTDISGVITTVTTYETAASTLAIAILLFLIGRTVVRKLVR